MESLHKMNKPTFRLLLLALSLATLTACSDSNDTFVATEDPEFLPIAQATSSTPPEVGSTSFLAQAFDLANVGYQQSEFFVSGTASSFTNLTELSPDGFWEVETAEQADYTTRIVVQRPIDPNDFSGTVVVEWLNVTAGFDNPVAWASGHVEIHRRGHVYVGVSAQQRGAENLRDSVDEERYADIIHPGDSFSYDIFSQAAQLLRNPAGVDPLDGLQPDYLLAVGESQSAFRLVTYINALHLLYNPYDGYIIQSRGQGAGGLSQPPQADLPVGFPTLVRTDIATPVMTFQADTDLPNQGGGLAYFNARQADSDWFRLWEVAGTAHADLYITLTGRTDSVGAPRFAAILELFGIPGFLRCDRPINAGPLHFVFARALNDMDRWMRTGQAPARAERLTLTSDGGDFILDQYGNATGGIRTPYVDAPAAVLSGLGNTGDGFCRLFGTTSLFAADQMASIYVDEAGYVSAVTDAANAAVEQGFLLREDADAIIEWSPQQWASQQND